MVPDDCENLFIPALAIQVPKNYSDALPTDGNLANLPVLMKGATKKRKAVDKGVPSSDPQPATNVSKGKWVDKEGVENGGDNDRFQSLTQNGNAEPSVEILNESSRSDVKPATYVSNRNLKDKLRNEDGGDNYNLQSLTDYGNVEPSLESLEGNSLAQTDMMSSGNGTGDIYSEFGSPGYSIRKDVVLPGVVLHICHGGKVAWDVKWKPSNPFDSDFKHRIGYLAVVLGKGSIEVVTVILCCLLWDFWERLGPE